MKKHGYFALLLALMLALGAAGCAEKAPQEPEREEAPHSGGADVVPEAPAAAGRPAVEDNGGQFVRVDDKVWFRRYDEGVINESQLWGNFLDVWPTHAVSSMLCYYDESGDAIVEALADDGFGELWFGTDGFYLMRSADGDAREAYYKTLDGAETVLRRGYVPGVSDNGRFAVVASEGGADGGRLYVYEGTSELRFAPYEEHYLEFCAVTDEGALLYLDRGGNTLCELGTDGAVRALGALPAPEDYGGFGYDWELEQCLLAGDEVWCTFGSYEGTGHFLSDALCVRAKLDAENSLEVIEDQPTTEYPFVPKLWRDESGAVCRGEHAPGEVEIAYESGDLCRYETADGKTLLIASFLPRDDDSDDMMVEQSMETLGGAVYLIVAEAIRDAENDIGWRMAYRPGALHYLRVPLRAETEVETLDDGEWGTAPSAAAVYAGLVGVWELSAVEVEGDRSDAALSDLAETLTFYEGETRAVIDSSGPDGMGYYNEFGHAAVVSTDAVSADAAPYGLLLSSEGTDDMMYAYREGDTLVATVLMHVENEYGEDAFSRTGFYVRAMG